ncbi:uncharacterized protein C8R40DRAFT_1171008 [Lentinula edodes]|uniref:uncharacterized protein n=1 Tax=Lentinula edodes TaxID=5353 RepID=UPI001E8EABBE|nr:uncharacterized protein C8R40DRAFT_1171008 [Lentinula edodes]KAH7874893.1 hypothetical protein C8R40DRAFT_1171008 [Lentinula edodes]
MAQNGAEEHEHAVTLLYHSGHVIAVIPQTLVYGIYAVLVPVSSYVMLRRGLATRARKILFRISIFMFLLSTVYWIASVSTLIQLIQVWFLASDPDAHSAPNYLPILNALALVNYIITDGVVVWRAWVLCSGDGTKALTMCLFMLGLATVSVTATIVIRIALMVIDTQVGELFNQLNHGINVTQVATLVLSLLTNSLATFLISLKAWRSRTEIRNNLDSVVDRHSRAGKIFALLVETGVIYSLSCVRYLRLQKKIYTNVDSIQLTVLVSTFVHLKEGTLGDLYTPASTQFAGIYPVVVLLLITQNNTLDRTVQAFASGLEETDFHHARQLDTMRFQRGSVISSETQTNDNSYWYSRKPGNDLSGLPQIPSPSLTWGAGTESV